MRTALSPTEIVHLVSEVAARGGNFHVNDLVSIEATLTERNKILIDFKKALNETVVIVAMAGTNLFTDSHPASRDGAFTSNDPKVRAYAL